MNQMTMRRFEDLPENDKRTLIGILIEEGMIDSHGYITPLGEEYIAAGDTQPIKAIKDEMEDAQG